MVKPNACDTSETSASVYIRRPFSRLNYKTMERKELFQSLLSSSPTGSVSLPLPNKSTAPVWYKGTPPNQFFTNGFSGVSNETDMFGIRVSSSPAKGRGVIINRTVITDNCICSRPRMQIVCLQCGFLTEGRVRVTCPLHKNTIYLMDMEVCGRCKASSHSLHELVMSCKDSNNNNQK